MDYSFQGCRPPAQLATMAASASSMHNQNWYTDLGATNHITNDLHISLLAQTIMELTKSQWVMVKV